MSKIIKLDDSADINDGQMEIYESKYLSPFRTIWELFTVGIKGISRTVRVSELELYTTSRPLLIQLDGEVFTLDANKRINLTCEKDSLRTIA